MPGMPEGGIGMSTKPAITQHYYQGQAVQPVIQKDRARNQEQKKTFLSILKKQANEDRMTFVLMRLIAVGLIVNVFNQVGIWRGWW